MYACMYSSTGTHLVGGRRVNSRSLFYFLIIIIVMIKIIIIIMIIIIINTQSIAAQVKAE